MPTELPDIPPNMQKVLKRFERQRSALTGRLPIPPRLWAPAVEAREHGSFGPRRLCVFDDGKLKQLQDSKGVVIVKKSGATKAVRMKCLLTASAGSPDTVRGPAGPYQTAGLANGRGRIGMRN